LHCKTKLPYTLLPNKGKTLKKWVFFLVLSGVSTPTNKKAGVKTPALIRTLCKLANATKQKRCFSSRVLLTVNSHCRLLALQNKIALYTFTKQGKNIKKSSVFSRANQFTVQVVMLLAIMAYSPLVP